MRLFAFTLAILIASPWGAGDVRAQSSVVAALTAAESEGATSQPATGVRERVFGRSGALRLAVLRALDAIDLPFVETVAGPAGTRYRWAPIFGGDAGLLGAPAFSSEVRAPEAPGMWRLETERAGVSPLLTVVTQVPISMKRAGILNGYRIGTYPTEGSGRTDVYAPPAGFIEVTPENQDIPISEHFTLRQFLTKDQANVWPKYVALRLELIDKLELVMQELNRMGVRADHMHVMSGFRTPQYNGPGGDGRAQLSRHMYGDAADVWVDNDRNGYIDDLNGDGRKDYRDADLMLRAVERVERKHPELAGGAGVYVATSSHGPFIHIDVRGTRSRW